jgi:ABC-type molybdate transport system substrate-binding protein
MNNRGHAKLGLACLIAVVLALATASFAQDQVQIRVMISGGFSAAFQEIQPEFSCT